MADPASWRLGDLAAYDAMRDDAALLVALTLHHRRAGGGDRSLEDARAVAQLVLAVDRADRSMVDEAAESFRARLAELATSL